MQVDVGFGESVAREQSPAISQRNGNQVVGLCPAARPALEPWFKPCGKAEIDGQEEAEQKQIRTHRWLVQLMALR